MPSFRFAPFFLSVYEIVQIAREKGSCVRPGQRGQQRRLLVFGITAVDPRGPVQCSSNAFLSAERNRTSRHRRRLRARATRGSHSGHLRKNTAATLCMGRKSIATAARARCAKRPSVGLSSNKQIGSRR